jgi:hypothetical protein
MTRAEWIPAAELAPGDLVRLPDGDGASSWAYWREREEAENAAAPFRRIERLEPSHDGGALQVWREGGLYNIVPRAADVLCRRQDADRRT